LHSSGIGPRFARRKRQPQLLAAETSEDKIDESLEESFPASDPPSWTLVTRIGSPRRNLELWTIPRPRTFLIEPQCRRRRGRLVRNEDRRAFPRAIPHLVPHRRFAMTTHKLDKKQWRTFFDRVSTTLEGKEAEIEIASLRLGDQVEAELAASARHCL